MNTWRLISFSHITIVYWEKLCVIEWELILAALTIGKDPVKIGLGPKNMKAGFAGEP